MLNYYEHISNKIKILSYLSKPQYQCFFSSGNLSKQSTNMMKVSQDFRLSFDNFNLKQW
jgi:hypothetical protein